jgi:hypothetical protein
MTLALSRQCQSDEDGRYHTHKLLRKQQQQQQQQKKNIKDFFFVDITKEIKCNYIFFFLENKNKNKTIVHLLVAFLRLIWFFLYI